METAAWVMMLFLVNSVISRATSTSDDSRLRGLEVFRLDLQVGDGVFQTVLQGAQGWPGPCPCVLMAASIWARASWAPLWVWMSELHPRLCARMRVAAEPLAGLVIGAGPVAHVCRRAGVEGQGRSRRCRRSVVVPPLQLPALAVEYRSAVGHGPDGRNRRNGAGELQFVGARVVRVLNTAEAVMSVAGSTKPPLEGGSPLLFTGRSPVVEQCLWVVLVLSFMVPSV